MINIQTQHEDLKNLILEKKLGRGIHRKVFTFRLDKRFVIKIAAKYPNINVLEEEIWQMVRETNIAKWFAPCVEISPCGIYLVQERVEVRPQSEYPAEIPSFFGDCKYTNFGWLNGQFVCCDYASFIATSMSHKWSGKMKKADWWE